MRGKTVLVFPMIAALLVTAMAAVPVFASPETLFVYPAEIKDPTKTLSTTLSITLEVDAGVLNLWGFGITLWYAPTVLTATSVTINTVKFPQTFPGPTINDTTGYVEWAAATGYGMPGVNGPLWLMKIDFKVDDFGESVLDIDDAASLLMDPLGGTITVTILDGYFSNTIHDIAITSVTATPSLIYVGENTIISVNLKNEGNMAEAFIVNLYNDTALLNTWPSVSLDAGSTTTLSFSWTPAADGTYTIKAEVPAVAGEEGKADNVATTTLTVRAPGPPTASFTWTPDSPYVGQTVSFDASLSTPNGGIITSYKWDFGNGTTETTTQPTVTHTYTKEGTYTITLTVTDDDGLTESITHQIAVKQPAPLFPTELLLVGLLVIAVAAIVAISLYRKRSKTRQKV